MRRDRCGLWVICPRCEANPHYNLVVLDGVFSEASEGEVRFHEASVASGVELVQESVATEVSKDTALEGGFEMTDVIRRQIPFRGRLTRNAVSSGSPRSETRYRAFASGIYCGPERRRLRWSFYFGSERRRSRHRVHVAFIGIVLGVIGGLVLGSWDFDASTTSVAAAYSTPTACSSGGDPDSAPRPRLCKAQTP